MDKPFHLPTTPEALARAVLTQVHVVEDHDT